MDGRAAAMFLRISEELLMSPALQMTIARGLVAGQFLLAATIVLTTTWQKIPSTINVTAAICLLAVGSGLAVWAWLEMGLRRLRIMPQPAQTAKLLSRGPYRYVRHPMYAGLLVATAGCLCWSCGTQRFLFWTLLFSVLEAKSRLEEQLLLTKFADYSAYRQRTWRFLPWVH